MHDALPLAGLRVVVTRSADQASALTDRLTDLGARTIEVTTIAIEPPIDGGAALRASLDRVDDHARVAVASPNGARALLAAWGGRADEAGVPVACVGPSTAAVLDGSAFSVDIVPDRNVSEGLVEAIGPPPKPGASLLLVQAEVARTVLADGLGELGWNVDRVVGYRTVDGVVDEAASRAAAGADIVTFTSSSTVDRYLRLAGRGALPPAIATIGPITSATAHDHGLTVDVEADPHTLDGLIEAVVRWAESGAGTERAG